MPASKQLIDRAVVELEAIGAKPQTIGGPTGSDAIGMGTEGRRFSLPSREAISRSYQIGLGSHQMDGGFCIAGCDKNKPGSVMGMLYANVPAIYVDAGTIKPGKWKGEDRDIASAFQSVGEAPEGCRAKTSRASSVTLARALAYVGGSTRRTLWRARTPRLA